jgi:hypothetical protein
MSIGVGGSMTVNATGGITSTSNAGLARAVGGTFMAKTGDEIGLFTPDGSMRGTMIQLSTEETVELRAKHVLLTADQELSFDLDSLGLALTPEGLELRGPIFLRAATVSFMGYPEDITGG